jgi:hypothetical protein
MKHRTPNLLSCVTIFLFLCVGIPRAYLSPHLPWASLATRYFHHHTHAGPNLHAAEFHSLKDLLSLAQRANPPAASSHQWIDSPSIFFYHRTAANSRAKKSLDIPSCYPVCLRQCPTLYWNNHAGTSFSDGLLFLLQEIYVDLNLGPQSLICWTKTRISTTAQSFSRAGCM